MKTEPKVILKREDFEKINSLILNSKSEIAELLEEELSRADVVSSEELPDGVVSMNSRVSFKDLDTGRESMLTLVYPHEAKIEESKVSILAPVGSALIGLRVGDIIHWPLPHGKEKRLKVISVANFSATT